MNKSERINGFDTLRTIAMWLGILLHAIIVYKATPEPHWPHNPQISPVFFDWLYEFIHAFRMPVFFMVAGFFARLVLLRSGSRNFIKQRFKRIFIPFIIGIIIIIPLTFLPFHFYHFYNELQMSFDKSVKGSLWQMVHWIGLGHLWFLYYLLIFYTVFLSVNYLLNKLKIGSADRLKDSLAKINLYYIILASLALFLMFYIFKFSEPPVYTGIKPNLLLFVYYGFFFLAGWLLQINMKSINSLTRFAWVLTLTGTLISVVLFLSFVKLLPVALYLVMAIQVISLVAGVTGLFIKYFNAESSLWRYCSDASYWVYLIHMIFVSFLQVGLYNSNVPGWMHLPIVLIVSLTFSLLTYHYFVRYTVIGEYLHGKRNKV